MKISTPVGAVSVLLLGASLLAACGGGSAPASSAPASSAAASKPATSAASASAAASKPAASGSASGSGSAAAKPAASGSAAASAAASTPAQATVKVSNNAKLGNILTDGEGKTLYTFDGQTTDPSKCPAACLAPWPAFVSTAAPTAPAGVTGKFAVITRPDNSAKQVTYNDMPLYYFVRDAAPGDANGQGVTAFGGNWQVIKAA